MNILILDIGTTSMRGILFDEEAHVLGISQYKNHPMFSGSIHVTEKPSDWTENTIQIVRNIVDAYGSEAVDAIAVTSQRSSVIPVDRHGHPLMDTIMWQDTRNAEICQRLKEYDELSFKKTGAHINTVFSGSKMAWVREEAPEIYQKTYKMTVIPEFVMHFMCGEFNTDCTYASRSGLLNLKKRSWDPEMIKIYGLDEEKLLSVSEPGETVGKTTEEFARLTGCRQGIPVISAGGDQQCGAIGQGAVRDGCVTIVTGTGGFLLAQCDSIPKDLKDDVICNCAAESGKYIIEANVMACSAVYDWCARQFFDMKESIDYRALENKLEELEQDTECLVIPYFKGRGVPDFNTRATAAFLNVTLATTREEMLKAAMEGIFMELRNHLDTFERYIQIGELHVSGGLTANKTLNQLQADIYDRPVMVMGEKEATAFGAFLVAAVSTGLYRSVPEAYCATRNDQGNILYGR